MKHIDNLLYALGQMGEYGKGYFKSQKEIIKLDVSEQSARILSTVISRLVIVLFFLFLLLFASLTLAFALAQYFDSYLWGFGIVAIVYLVLILIIVFFKRVLIRNPILKILLNDILH